jgi:hypothetical protein
MPRRSYRIYLDSTVLSRATDSKIPTQDAAVSRLCLRSVRDVCTLVYSAGVIRENGPARSELPHLAKRRLAALRGSNVERLPASRAEVEIATWEILRLAKRENVDRDSSIARDARHAAAALLGKVDLFVTGNTADFGLRGTLRSAIAAAGSARKATLRIATPEQACGLIAENPRPRGRFGMTPGWIRLYARQQYWSMRDYGYSSAYARAFIKRKWGVTP